MIQALYHRERTGEGQRVDTSIIYAHLLNVSSASLGIDGTPGARPHLDAMALGLSPRYRLYETADGWLCIAAITDGHWQALCSTLRVAEPAPVLSTDDVAAIEAAFRTRSATDWFDALDTVGVPCEVSSDTFALGAFDDPELIERGWVSATRHPVVGRIDMAGLGFDFSETPGCVQGPPVFVGQESREILREVGYSDEEIDALCHDGVVLDTAPVATPVARSDAAPLAAPGA